MQDWFFQPMGLSKFDKGFCHLLFLYEQYWRPRTIELFQLQALFKEKRAIVLVVENNTFYIGKVAFTSFPMMIHRKW